VIGAIAIHIGTLRHPKASAADKAQALKLLGHFIADVHQPLHAGRAEDRGGTAIKVRFLGEETSLHAVWDSSLIAGMGLDWQTVANRLHASILDAERVTWQRSDVHDWVEEARRFCQVTKPMRTFPTPRFAVSAPSNTHKVWTNFPAPSPNLPDESEFTHRTFPTNQLIRTTNLLIARVGKVRIA
jgi:hypothetical protein